MAYRSTGSGVNGSGTSASPGVPSGLQVDDIVVLALYLETSDVITWPTGFTQKLDQSTNSTTRGRIVMAWKRITVAGDATDEGDGDYDISWTTSGTYEAVAVAFSGRLKIGDPFDVVNSNTTATTTATTINQTLTTLVDADDIICFSSNHATNAGDFTAPSGMTERYDATGGGAGHHLAAYTQDNAGSAGGYSKTATSTGTTGNSTPKIVLGGLQADRVAVRSAVATSGTTSSTLTVTLPTHATGDLLLAFAPGKYDTASQPTVTSGWTLVKFATGGTGAQANNGGPVFLAVAAKIATSSSESNPTFTAGGTAPNNWHGQAASILFPAGSGHADTLGSNVNWIETAQDTDVSSSTFTGTTSAFTNQPTTGDLLIGLEVGPSSAGGGFNSQPTVTATGMSNGLATTALLYAESNVGANSMSGLWYKQGFTGPLSSGVLVSASYTGWSTASGLIAAISIRQGIGTTNVTGGRATETDTISAGTVHIGVNVTGGRASETDTARAGTVQQPIVGGRATESDTARAGSVSVSYPGGRASETDTARTGTLNITYLGGRATETDTARAGATLNAFVYQGGRATETDIARAGTVNASLGVAGGRATETDTARAGSVRVNVAGGRATETDTARAGRTGVVVVGGRATETDTARHGAISTPVVVLGQASETDTATTFTYDVPASETVDLGQASETDTSRPISLYVTGVAGDLTVFVIDDELQDTPANILVDVGNGNDGETVNFSIFGPSGFYDLLTTELDDDDGILQVQLELSELDAGTYVLTVAGTVSGAATDTFVVLSDPLDDTPDAHDGVEVEEPSWTTDLTHHWQLIDTTIGDEHSYTFPHNPARWANPTRPNFLEHEVTTAPDGNILAWQGAERSWTFEFSGYLDTQAQYEALQFWSELRRRFWLIDHRDKAHYVTFEQLDVRARIVPNKPWAHDYTVRAVHFYARPD